MRIRNAAALLRDIEQSGSGRGTQSEVKRPIEFLPRPPSSSSCQLVRHSAQIRMPIMPKHFIHPIQSLSPSHSTFLACDSARSPLVGRIVYYTSSRQISFHNLMLICFFFGFQLSQSQCYVVFAVYLRQPKQFPPNTLINVKQAQQWAAHAHTRTPKLHRTAQWAIKAKQKTCCVYKIQNKKVLWTRRLIDCWVTQ